MTKVFGFVFAFCMYSCALAQSETALVPNKPINVSFEDLAVVRILQIDSKPTIAIAKFIQKEKETVSTVVRTFSLVEEKQKRTVIVDGKQVEQEYTVQVPTFVDSPAGNKNFTPNRLERFCPLSGVKVFDVKGTLVEPEAWRKLLEKPRHVLLLKDPVGEKNPLDPFYMSIIREDTLLIFLPNQVSDSKTE